MVSILIALAWIAGICVVQNLPALPETSALIVISLIACLGIIVGLRIGRLRVALWTIASFGLAIVWVSALAVQRLEDRVSIKEDDKVTRVVVQVDGLPAATDNGVRFIGRLVGPLAQGLPERVMVFWPHACTGDCPDAVEPGQRWRMALRFRRPAGRMNFHGFDSQGWMFQQNVRAEATVRGTPIRLPAVTGWWPSIWVEQIRSHIRRRLQRLLADKPERAVLIALSIGDQQGVSAEDWTVFNLTGITHLVSISGSHVTLIAAAGAGCLASLYRRLRWRNRLLSQRWPVRLVFVWAAGLLAFAYCLLAGWGVPAQRTFFMLLAGALALSGRLPITGTQAIIWAAVVMSFLDPWAVLSTGFWLSFGAMAVLIQLATSMGESRALQGVGNETNRWQRAWQALWVAARVQWVMTLALTPVTIYLFHQLSLASLPANAWAIPWVTFVATPLALLVSGLSLTPLPDTVLWPVAWLAHASLALSLAPVRALARFSWLSMETAAISGVVLLLGIIAVVLGLCLPPSRARAWAWFLIVPSLLGRPQALQEGAWEMIAFDVGQGGAVLIRTQKHAVLYDTGWRHGQANAADKVIIPELRALGIKRLDQVIVSHPDMDHIGGLQALQDKRSITTLTGSGLNRRDVLACQAGQTQTMDGVRFTFIHPSDGCSTKSLKGLERNRCSCVLEIQGTHHRALLTGDIDSEVESSLLTSIIRPYDVVTIAHHGSSTASSQPWIKAVNATHAIAQAGAYNRFGHPHPDVVQRWVTHGTKVWVSSQHGAVKVRSSSDKLLLSTARLQRQRYWHEPALTTAITTALKPALTEQP